MLGPAPRPFGRPGQRDSDSGDRSPRSSTELRPARADTSAARTHARKVRVEGGDATSSTGSSGRGKGRGERRLVMTSSRWPGPPKLTGEAPRVSRALCAARWHHQPCKPRVVPAGMLLLWGGSLGCRVPVKASERRKAGVLGSKDQNSTRPAASPRKHRGPRQPTRSLPLPKGQCLPL